jgi:hypothetical protein
MHSHNQRSHKSVFKLSLCVAAIHDPPPNRLFSTSEWQFPALCVPPKLWQIFRIYAVTSHCFPIPWLRSWAEAAGLNGENTSALEFTLDSSQSLDISQLLDIHPLAYKSQQKLVSTSLALKYENVACSNLKVSFCSTIFKVFVLRQSVCYSFIICQTEKWFLT